MWIVSLKESLMLPFQMLCTLCYTTKADFFSEVRDIHGVSKSSVSVYIPKVCQTLCEHLRNIKFSSSIMSLRKMKQQFYWMASFYQRGRSHRRDAYPYQRNEWRWGAHQCIKKKRSWPEYTKGSGRRNEVCPDIVS